MSQNQEDGAQDVQPESVFDLNGPPAVPPRVWGPLPAPPKFVVTLPEGVTHKLLNTIHLTAQFVVYGIDFYFDLKKRMDTNPLFDFLKPTHGMFDYFDRKAVWSSCIIKPSVDMPTMPVVIEGFFRLLCRIEEMGMYVYLGGFSPMDDEECSQPRELKLGMPSLRSQLPPPPMGFLQAHEPYIQPPHPGFKLDWPSRTPPLPPQLLPEEQKFNESVLVPEDLFLARHPGFSTVIVFILGTFFIEIIVESLSETVATLKKKIAGETQYPPNKQKLIGKTGVLNENRSLAHYNVGEGETLTLIYMFNLT